MSGHRKIRAFICRCKCGAEQSVLLQSLTSGHSQSCGCCARESGSVHEIANRIRAYMLSHPSEVVQLRDIAARYETLPRLAHRATQHLIDSGEFVAVLRRA